MKKQFEEYKSWCERVKVHPCWPESLDMFYSFKRMVARDRQARASA